MKYVHLRRGVQTAQKQPAPPASQTKGFVDQRPEFAAQRKLIAGIRNSSGVAQCSLKIGEKVYDIEKGKYRVNGKEIGNYQSVITEIKKDVEKEPKEKTEAGEKMYKWDDNWNNIVADFVERNGIVKFSNIGEFVGEMENTINQDYVMLNRFLKGLSAVKMMRSLKEITFDESVLEKEFEQLSESIEKTQNEINIIEQTCLDKEELQKNVTAKKNILDKLVEEHHSLSEEQLNLYDEKKIIFTHWENIVTCRKILEKYPLAKKLERFRMDLLDVEINFAEKAPEMNDELLLPTKQEKDTNMCWFLSVFEGLRRAKLVYPIVQHLMQDSEMKPILHSVSGLQDWQSILEYKFMKKNGLPKLDSQTFRLSKGKNKVEDTEFMKTFFNGKDTEVPGVLSDYTYCRPVDSSLNFKNEDWGKRLNSALNSLPKKGNIQINKDTKEISFYTVDKPNHAMFYLGILDGEKEFVEAKINELKLIYENELKKIGDMQKNKISKNDNTTISERKKLKTEMDNLILKAKSKFEKEMEKINTIRSTGYTIRVYNQASKKNDKIETYRLGQIERIQKHTFTLKKKATSTK